MNIQTIIKNLCPKSTKAIRDEGYLEGRDEGYLEGMHAGSVKTLEEIGDHISNGTMHLVPKTTSRAELINMGVPEEEIPDKIIPFKQ